MSNSVLDNLAESDQSETDSFKGEKPVGRKIHLRDVLAAVSAESPVKAPPAEKDEENGENDPPSKKRRIPRELANLQDTEEYLEATKAVRSTDSAPERSKRPTRRAAVIARENVNFLAGNVQNGIELRESRKANERAQRIMAAEIQTDSETEEESTESLTPAGTSIDSIIQNSDLFDCSPEKQVPKKVPPPPPLTPKTPQVSSGEPPIKRTFGKSANTSQNGNQANSKNKKERPPDFSTDKKVPPPILPKIKRKSPSAKSAAPKLVDPKLTQNLPDKKPTPTVTHPPPPPLKRAPPRDRDQPGTDAKKLKSEKLVKSDAIKVAIEPPTVPNVKKTEKKTERKELESKKSDGNTADIKISKSETKASKPDVKKSELQSDIDYARVDKIKVMFRNWIVERQKRQNRTNV